MGFSVIAGADVAYDAGTGQFLAEYKNGQFASFGSCGDQIANGDKVLYAYADGSEQLLELSAVVPVAGATSVRFTVTDAATAHAVAGASVGGVDDRRGRHGPGHARRARPGDLQGDQGRRDPLQRRDGVLDERRRRPLRHGAAAPVAARASTNGLDGSCGSRDLTAPLATITQIKDGQRFTRAAGAAHAARQRGAGRLRPARGQAAPDAHGRRPLHVLQRRVGALQARQAWPLRGARTASGSASGAAQQTDYLLPSKLPRGRYVLDANVIDKAFNRDDTRRRGANRVVFHVA